jgi:hypothetical protein
MLQSMVFMALEWFIVIARVILLLNCGELVNPLT